jgi:hypothetical protein
MLDWTYSSLVDPSAPSGSSTGGGGTSYGQVDLDLLYAELALDPTTGDLAIPARIIRGAEAIAQRLRVRFRFFLGEWFLDRRLGVPYFRDVLKKNPDEILIASILRTVLLSTPGIARVDTLEARLDRPTRTLSVNFVALLEDGSTILRAVDEPFILE